MCHAAPGKKKLHDIYDKFPEIGFQNSNSVICPSLKIKQQMHKAWYNLCDAVEHHRLRLSKARDYSLSKSPTFNSPATHTSITLSFLHSFSNQLDLSLSLPFHSPFTFYDPLKFANVFLTSDLLTPTTCVCGGGRGRGVHCPPIFQPSGITNRPD